MVWLFPPGGGVYSHGTFSLHVWHYYRPSLGFLSFLWANLNLAEVSLYGAKHKTHASFENFWSALDRAIDWAGGLKKRPLTRA